jgi:hypothetical protein
MDRVDKKEKEENMEKFGCVELNGVVIYNTTPHVIRFFCKGEVWLEIPRADKPLQVPEINQFCGTLEGIPLFSKLFGGDYLPSPRDGVYFIVSADVAMVFPRKDFLVPYGVEESEGVINCIGLAFME